MPVVGVDDVRHKDGTTKADIGGDARQRGKAQRVSGQSIPSALTYGLPGRANKCGASSTKRLSSTMSPGAGGPRAEEVRQMNHAIDLPERIHHAGVPGTMVRTSTPSAFRLIEGRR